MHLSSQRKYEFSLRELTGANRISEHRSGGRWLWSGLLVIAWAAMLSSGCGRGGTAEAVPRDTVAQVQSFADLDGEPDSASWFAPAYSHADHFAVLIVDVVRLTEQWPVDEITADELLLPWLGPLDTLVQSVEDLARVSFILDEQFFTLVPSFEGNDAQTSPGLTVLEFQAEWEWPTELPEFVRVNGDTDRYEHLDQPIQLWRADERSIVLGSPRAIEKLLGEHRLGHALYQSPRLRSGSAVSGHLLMEPVKSALQPLLNMVPGMADGMRDFTRVLNALDRIDFSVNLRHSPLGTATFYVADATTAAEWKSQMENMLHALSEPAGPAEQMMREQLTGPWLEEQMIPLSAVEWYPKVIEETVGGGIRLTQLDAQVSITLPRPRSLDTLLSAMGRDARALMELQTRLDQMQTVIDALLAYHADHGEFPATHWRRDDSSEPFSWRVALLPYLGDTTLYESFNFGEPWDSEHNLAVASQTPPVFAGDIEGMTRIRLVGAPAGVFSDDRPATLSDVGDNHARTACVIEVGQSSAIEWHRPATFSVEVNEDRWPDLGRPDERGIIAGMFDGTVRMVVKQNTQGVTAVLTANAGDRPGRSAFFDWD